MPSLLAQAITRKCEITNETQIQPGRKKILETEQYFLLSFHKVYWLSDIVEKLNTIYVNIFFSFSETKPQSMSLSQAPKTIIYTDPKLEHFSSDTGTILYASRSY